jgi:hypothetical protein
MIKFYGNSILGPYMKPLRDQFSDQSLNLYLVGNNHGTHTGPDILTLLQGTRVVPIWLSPHSSHFLQPWDLAVFGSFKRNYGNLRRPELKPQVEGKILRVLHARRSTKYVGCIDTGWRRGAVDVEARSSGQGTGVSNIRTVN